MDIQEPQQDNEMNQNLLEAFVVGYDYFKEFLPTDLIFTGHLSQSQVLIPTVPNSDISPTVLAYLGDSSKIKGDDGNYRRYARDKLNRSNGTLTIINDEEDLHFVGKTELLFKALSGIEEFSHAAYFQLNRERLKDLMDEYDNQISGLIEFDSQPIEFFGVMMQIVFLEEKIRTNDEDFLTLVGLERFDELDVTLDNLTRRYNAALVLLKPSELLKNSLETVYPKFRESNFLQENIADVMSVLESRVIDKLDAETQTKVEQLSVFRLVGLKAVYHTSYGKEEWINMKLTGERRGSLRPALEVNLLGRIIMSSTDMESGKLGYTYTFENGAMLSEENGLYTLKSGNSLVVRHDYIENTQISLEQLKEQSDAVAVLQQIPDLMNNLQIMYDLLQKGNKIILNGEEIKLENFEKAYKVFNLNKDRLLFLADLVKDKEVPIVSTPEDLKISLKIVSSNGKLIYSRTENTIEEQKPIVNESKNEQNEANSEPKSESNVELPLEIPIDAYQTELKVHRNWDALSTSVKISADKRFTIGDLDMLNFFAGRSNDLSLNLHIRTYNPAKPEYNQSVRPITISKVGENYIIAADGLQDYELSRIKNEVLLGISTALNYWLLPEDFDGELAIQSGYGESLKPFKKFDSLDNQGIGLQIRQAFKGIPVESLRITL